MKTLLIALIAALTALTLMMAGLGVKIFFKKHGTFKRRCSSMDPYTGETSGCICGKTQNTHCNKPTHSPLEVNQELLNEL